MYSWISEPKVTTETSRGRSTKATTRIACSVSCPLTSRRSRGIQEGLSSRPSLGDLLDEVTDLVCQPLIPRHHRCGQRAQDDGGANDPFQRRLTKVRWPLATTHGVLPSRSRSVSSVSNQKPAGRCRRRAGP